MKKSFVLMMPTYSKSLAVGVSGLTSWNDTPPSTNPPARIDLFANPRTLVFEMFPTVVRLVEDRDAVTLVSVAASASGSLVFISTAYTRRTSRPSISRFNGTCSSSITPAATSAVLPLIVIIALVTDIPFVMVGAPVLGV